MHVFHLPSSHTQRRPTRAATGPGHCPGLQGALAGLGILPEPGGQVRPNDPAPHRMVIPGSAVIPELPPRAGATRHSHGAAAQLVFCWTELGAEHVGIIQSVIATCRLHGADPWTWLVDVLERVASHPAKDVAQLTPRLWKDRFAADPMTSGIGKGQTTPQPTQRLAAWTLRRPSGDIASHTAKPRCQRLRRDFCLQTQAHVRPARARAAAGWNLRDVRVCPVTLAKTIAVSRRTSQNSQEF